MILGTYCICLTRSLVLREHSDRNETGLYFQNGERLGLGFYSELDQEHENSASVATNLFPSPSRTDDSDTNWSERASSRSSNTPAVIDHAPLAITAWKGIKREKIAETEVNVILSPSANEHFMSFLVYI